VRAVVEGTSGDAAGEKEDVTLVDSPDCIALAGWPPRFEGQPCVILSIGPYRLYLVGEDALESVASAIAAAYGEPK
jgi:hypothetical protein